MRRRRTRCCAPRPPVYSRPAVVSSLWRVWARRWRRSMGWRLCSDTWRRFWRRRVRSTWRGIQFSDPALAQQILTLLAQLLQQPLPQAAAQHQAPATVWSTAAVPIYQVKAVPHAAPFRTCLLRRSRAPTGHCAGNPQSLGQPGRRDPGRFVRVVLGDSQPPAGSGYPGSEWRGGRLVPGADRAGRSAQRRRAALAKRWRKNRRLSRKAPFFAPTNRSAKTNRASLSSCARPASSLVGDAASASPADARVASASGRSMAENRQR